MDIILCAKTHIQLMETIIDLYVEMIIHLLETNKDLCVEANTQIT